MTDRELFAQLGIWRAANKIGERDKHRFGGDPVRAGWVAYQRIRAEDAQAEARRLRALAIVSSGRPPLHVHEVLVDHARSLHAAGMARSKAACLAVAESMVPDETIDRQALVLEHAAVLARRDRRLAYPGARALARRVAQRL